MAGSKVDPKVRAIYYTMLKEDLFGVHPSQDYVSFTWLYEDNDAAEEISTAVKDYLRKLGYRYPRSLEEHRMRITKELLKKLKEEKSNEVG